MNITEIILSVLTVILSGANVTQFLYIKSNKQKQQAEADSTKDCVLYKRIEFLDERITKLESMVCFKRECKERVK